MENGRNASRKLRVAAGGDIHGDADSYDRLRAVLTEAADADLVLLAGDLTTHGEPEQAQVVAAAAMGLGVPVVAVLGNHDWHADRRGDVVSALEAGGIRVLERSWTVVEAAGLRVGVVGTKGFVGGFPDSQLPDFGEPLLRAVYAYATAEVEAIEHGLEEIADCDVRIVLLHYAPTAATLEGEPPVIWAFLGNMRMAGPIARHQPDLVLHGHAHRGRFEGSVAGVPVRNVAEAVIGPRFARFELAPRRGVRTLVPAD
jgi:Icc-related predicted phosphoesterase